MNSLNRTTHGIMVKITILETHICMMNNVTKGKNPHKFVIKISTYDIFRRFYNLPPIKVIFTPSMSNFLIRSLSQYTHAYALQCNNPLLTTVNMPYILQILLIEIHMIFSWKLLKVVDVF